MGANPMVILCGLAFYDDPEEIENREFTNGTVEHLIGLDHDVKNLKHLFHTRLNYRYYPPFDQYPKLKWSKKELLNLLEVQAKEFNDNLYHPDVNPNGFDGLICAVSAHGINQSVLTSDYGLIEKKTVYRTFTDNYPLSRQFP